MLLCQCHHCLLSQSLKYLLLPCHLSGHWCFSDPSLSRVISLKWQKTGKQNPCWVFSRELDPFTRSIDSWQGRNYMLGKSRASEGEGQVSLLGKQGAVGAGRLSCLIAPILLVVQWHPGSRASLSPSSILQWAGQVRQDRPQEPLQDGFHWASDLGEAIWQSGSTELWEIWPREEETEKEGFPGSSCSSSTSCFGYCTPSPMLVCSKTFRGSERITRTTHLLLKGTQPWAVHMQQKTGVRIWRWTWQARDNEDQAKTQGPSSTGSGRVWHGICAVPRLATGDDGWSRKSSSSTNRWY